MGQGIRFDRSLRVSIADEGSSKLASENKRRYRLVRDVRTGNQVEVEIGKHAITTPNVQDVAAMVAGGGFGLLEIAATPPVMAPRPVTTKAKKKRIKA